jgi:UPF0271 protein
MVELNADVGEGMGHDVALLEVIDRANIACGFHAGDAASMGETVRGAIDNGVAVGAHVSYLDREGFGRRRLAVSEDELIAQLREQIETLTEVAGGLGAAVGHLKAHGALYNDAASDRGRAELIVTVMADYPSVDLLLAPETSAMAEVASLMGVRVLREGFPDRGYNPDGTLADRGLDGAVVDDPETVALRAHRMATSATIDAMDGSVIPLRVDTVCVHGDSLEAIANAREVRARLGPRSTDQVGQQ